MTSPSPANPTTAPTDEAITEAVRIEFNHPEDEAAVQRVARHIANLYAALQRPTQSTREQLLTEQLAEADAVIQALKQRARESTREQGEAPGAAVSLEQIVARANSFQNANNYNECIRQLACIDLIARRALGALRSVPVPAPSLASDDWKHCPGTEALLESWQTDNQMIILMGDGRYDCRVKSEQRWWEQIGEADTLDAAKQCFAHSPVPAPEPTEELKELQQMETVSKIACSAKLPITPVPPPGVTDWQPIETAPLNATWVFVRVPVKRFSPDYRVVHAHWAHGGGDDQPAFGPDWFYDTGHGFHNVSPKPTHWAPSLSAALRPKE